jgi:hypothetical protein
VLGDSTFNACWTYAYRPDVGDGIVIGQWPPARTSAPTGARVDLVVASHRDVRQLRAFDCAHGRPKALHEVLGAPPSTVQVTPPTLPSVSGRVGPAPAAIVAKVLRALPEGFTVTRADTTAFGAIRFPDMAFQGPNGSIVAITIESDLDLRTVSPTDYFDTATANVWVFGRRVTGPPRIVPRPMSTGVIVQLPGRRVAFIRSPSTLTPSQPLMVTSLESVAVRLIDEFR